MRRHEVRPDEIWPGIAAGARTLWTARLFPATRRRDDARAARPLSNGRADKRAWNGWRQGPRWSMAMLLARADPRALIEHREVVWAHLQTEGLLDAIRRREDQPLDALVGRYASAAAYRRSEERLEQWASQPAGGDPALAIDQARARWAVVQLLQRPDHPQSAAARPRIEPQMRAAFAKVAEAGEIGHARVEVRPRAPAPDALKPGVEVVATAPVRLDLAGGWSDTPPYCFERGGHVVNVAIDLDGRPPMRAVVRTLAEPKLVLESHDLGRRVELCRVVPAGELDVRDPFALHHVALRTAGLLPDGHGDVAKHLRALGAGLHVVTESRVPKGSGLGTSSILAATLLAALHRLRGGGARPTRDELVEQTLLLEQRLGTGGGWQDQVGGIVPGVKSTVTAPGVPQRPAVETLGLSDRQVEALQERLVVYYSGQQRLARDILRRVMGRWLAREPAVVGLMDSLKSGAAALRAALLRGRWRDAGREVGRYWQIKKELYPGSTTPAIDLLLLETRDDCLAAGLAGAGGGGFAYFLCADARQARRLRDRLAAFESRPGSLGSVYAARINQHGLTVTRRKL
jgi:galactokinase/mevalonate kinase-like predicted kinase